MTRTSYFFLTIFPKDVPFSPQTWERKFTRWTNKMGCDWFIGQWEICPTTGSVHTHVYLYVEKRLRFEQIKKSFEKYFGYNLSDVQVRKGTHQEAKKYVTKEATRMAGFSVFQWGTEPSAPEPGKRTDLLWAAEIVRNERSFHRIIHERPDLFVRYHAGLQSLLGEVQQEQAEDSNLEHHDIVKIAFTGPGGTGKSYMARAICRMLRGQLGWRTYQPQFFNGQIRFDNYNSQEILFVDEFYSNIPYSDFVLMTDSAWNTMPRRYGMTMPQWKLVIFTSNANYPLQWYGELQLRNPDCARAISRRFWHQRWENPFGLGSDDFQEPTEEQIKNILGQACNRFRLDMNEFFGFIEPEPTNLLIDDNGLTPDWGVGNLPPLTQGGLEPNSPVSRGDTQPMDWDDGSEELLAAMDSFQNNVNAWHSQRTAAQASIGAREGSHTVSDGADRGVLGDVEENPIVIWESDYSEEEE